MCRELGSSPKKFARRTSGFPRFVQGNVYIMLAKSDTRYCYAFEKSILSRQSSWFSDSLELEAEEVDETVASHLKKWIGYEMRYELQYDKEDKFWSLELVVRMCCI